MHFGQKLIQLEKKYSLKLDVVPFMNHKCIKVVINGIFVEKSGRLFEASETVKLNINQRDGYV